MRTIENKKKLALLILAILLVIVVAGITVYAIRRDIDNNSTQGQTEKEKIQQENQQNEEKQQYIEATNNPNNEPQPAPVPTSSDTISISVEKTSESSVTVITQLEGYASGNCELVITNGQKTYTATASILYQPEHSTCAGFSVPVASLEVGVWHIKLNAIPSNSASVSKEIDYAVK